jgi:hypothetical protein
VTCRSMQWLSDSSQQMASPEHVSTEESGEETRRFLIRRPKALQYFYNKELHKASTDERQAGRFELFLDLLCEYLIE